MLRKPVTLISLYYCFIFMSNGSYGSYIGLYYNEVNLDALQIGVITAAASIIAIFVQPFWGVTSDRATYKNHILIFVLLMSALTIWLIPLSGGLFWTILLATLLLTAFQCAINPLGDAMTLELASKHNFTFANVRTVGSVGFAVMSLVVGWLIHYGIHYIFVVYSILILFALSLSPFIPKVHGHQRKGNKVQFKHIFQDRKLVHLYAFTTIIQASLGFFFAFHAIYSVEQGISTTLIGWGLLIGSFSQFPFMIFFDRLYERFGIVNILIFSGVIHAIRWMITAFYFTSQTILLTWILHGGTFMLFYLCLAQYIHTKVRPELKASGQMMNSIVIQGFSKVAGSLIGGALAYSFGIQTTFFIAGLVCIAAVVIFSYIFKKTTYVTEVTETTTTS